MLGYFEVGKAAPDVAQPQMGAGITRSVSTAPASVSLLIRAVHRLGKTLFVLGTLLGLFVAYQAWGTEWAEARNQAPLREQFQERVQAASAALPVAGGDLSVAETTAEGQLPTGAAETSSSADVDGANGRGSAGITDAAPVSLEPVETGEAFARLEMPTIDVDKIVVQGVGVEELRAGPGHYESTAAVGHSGNAGIAGHRTTYGAPFGDIDQLEAGDEIVVTNELGSFAYEVMPPEQAFPRRLDDALQVADSHVIVDPSATWVLSDFGDDRLTLTACHPKFSSRERIVVSAQLVGHPVDAPPPAEPSEANTVQVGEGSAPELATEAFTPQLQREVVPPPPGSDALLEASAAEAQAVGLSGETRGFFEGAAWLGLAFLSYYAGRAAARRFSGSRTRSYALRMVTLLPLAFSLWNAFAALDRALPAY